MGTVIVQAPNRVEERRKALAPPSLEEVQKLVGGYVEIVWRGQTADGQPAQFYVNEEGLIHDLPLNPMGNLLFARLFNIEYPQLFRGAVVALVGEDAQWT